VEMKQTMNIPEIKWKNSIFSRLMITLLCVMMPVYFLGFIIYNWGVNTIRTEIMNSNNSQMTFLQSNLESEIKRIKLLQYGSLNDRDLQDLSNKAEIMTEFEKNMAILRLERTLYAIQNSSKYILEVKAFIPAIDTTITAVGDVGKLDAKEYTDLLSLQSVSPSQLFLFDNKLILTSNIWVNGVSKTNDQSPIITVELSRNAIINTLDTFNDYQHSGYILLDRTQAYSIPAGKDKDLSQAFEDRIAQDPPTVKSSTGQVRINGSDILVFSKESSYLNMQFIKYVPEDDIFNKVKQYRTWFLAFTVVSLVIIVFASVSSYKYIHQPLRKFVKAFYLVEKGEMNTRIDSRRHDEFGYLYKKFNAMLENLRTLIDQVYKQTILAQKAELKQLQSQINPHFLYNSFFVLSTQIETEDYSSAKLFSRQLGEYFQFITRNASDEVTLLKETEHARVYASIQGARVGKRIKIEFRELPQECEKIIVPRLILQPLLENVFEHGLQDTKGNGLVRVFFENSGGGEMLLSVEDNGANLEDRTILEMNEAFDHKDETAEVTGIVNIHRRIQLRYGPESGCRAERSELGGLKIVIRIKYGGTENVQIADCG
jgi:two-component system sensor histidine kinase YesM